MNLAFSLFPLLNLACKTSTIGYYYKDGELHSTIFQIQHFSADERASGTANARTARHMYDIFDHTRWWYPGTTYTRHGLYSPSLSTIRPRIDYKFQLPNSPF